MYGVYVIFFFFIKLFCFNFVVVIIIIVVVDGVLGEDFLISIGLWCWIKGCLFFIIVIMWMFVMGKFWEVFIYLVLMFFYLGFKYLIW